ncbi:MAG: glycyl-radical enzyme activating protein [Sporomusaceae bacterium]|nr:glycyl-radical enzyme activating protein [Sporomusaceae bacterium]
METIYSGKGIISDIQRFSVHDGPGIRTLVFFKGCPLSCQWCCNPENIQREPQTMMVQGVEKVIGREYTVEELMQVIRKDMIYYRRSGGGVTLSGGEVLFQPQFAKQFLQACKAESIHTAIETTAFASFEVIRELLPWIDLAMCDLKHVDGLKHLQYTGRPNDMILENLRKIGLSGTSIVIRVPVVPGFNSTKDEISRIALYAATIPGVKQLHLLPYHRLGESKYNGLGKNYAFSGIEPLQPVMMEELLEVAKYSGLNCQIGG